MHKKIITLWMKVLFPMMLTIQWDSSLIDANENNDDKDEHSDRQHCVVCSVCNCFYLKCFPGQAIKNSTLLYRQMLFYETERTLHLKKYKKNKLNVLIANIHDSMAVSMVHATPMTSTKTYVKNTLEILATVIKVNVFVIVTVIGIVAGIRKVYHEYGHTADNKSLVDNIDNAIESCRPCIRNNEAWNEKRSHSFNDYNVKLSEVPQTKQHGGERMSVIIFCTACAHKDCSLISTALRKSTRKCKMYSEILSLKSGKEYWANSEEKSVYKCITKQLEENSSYICLEDIAITKRPGEVADIYFLVFMCPFSKSMNEKYKTSNLQLIDTAYCSIEFVLNKLECFNFQISFSQTRKIANATATVYALEYYGLTRNDFPLLENFSQRETNQKFLSSSRGKITQNNVVTYTSDFEANVTNCSLGSTFSFVTTNSTQVNSLNDNFQELLSLSLRNYFITRPDLPMKNNTSTYQLESYLKGLQVFPDQRNTSICCDISQPIIVDNHSENFKTFNAHLSQARCKLSAACANDQVDEIEHIVNKYTVLCSTISNTLIINIRNEDGETPLIIACITRSSNAIRWLLKQSDIDVNATDEKSNTALHYVIITNRSGGRTQLHEACENGDFEKVKNMLYVTQRHDVNVQDNDGWTPLHLACFTGQEKIVSLLLWAGADVDIRDEDWRTPADVAEIANCDYLIDMLNLRPMADWRPAYFQFYIDLMNTSFNPDDDAT